jgi:ABC-type branched-subunit amino acid transport system permease subunit
MSEREAKPLTTELTPQKLKSIPASASTGSFMPFIGGMYGLMGAGLSLIWGVMDICNFAHGSLYMIGVYFTYLAFPGYGLDPILSIIVATFAVFFALGSLLRNPHCYVCVGRPGNG